MPALADTPQQEKMKACNADAKAKALSGDARKTFMKECLGAKPATAAEPEKKLTPQQQKMKDCAAKNKGLKGDEYKKAQSECLKAK
ncbi:MAG TPA: PsiF family protein [Burkholderiales bacterium]|nr:PsiF family protein [Burkholderiales bacterium]